MSADRQTKTPWLVWAAVAAIALVAIIGLFTSVFYTNVTEPRQVPPAKGTTPSDIVQNSSTYLGQTVTVNGHVAGSLGPRVLVMVGGGGGPGSDQPLLVLASQPDTFAAGVAANDTIQVTGTVRRFVLSQARSDLGIDLNEQQMAPYEGKPALVAQSLTRSAATP